jgi:hypothetical protein
MKSGFAQNGSMGTTKKNKAELFDDAKASYERDKKFLEEFHDDRAKRSTQVGALVPGADIGSNDDLVANGPHVKHRDLAQRNRIFLWRNAVQGDDFALRYAKLKRHGN